MKALQRHNPTYSLSRLPKLESNCIQDGNILGYTGTIVRRKIKGPIKIYWHYAFIYGFDKDNRLLLIENNEDGVECITWNDFILNHIHWEFVHFETDQDNFKSIMSRAKERARHSYDPNRNNCQHFINYCIFGKLESIQVDNTKLGVNALLLYFEMCLINTPDPYVPTLLKQVNKMRAFFDLKRGAPEIDEIVDKRIGPVNNTPIETKPKVLKYKLKKRTTE